MKNNRRIVAKFGGTSMGTAVAMKKSAQIVLSNPEICVVVVSATSGTTNELLKIIEKYHTVDIFHEHNQIEDLIEILFQKHLKIIEDLELQALAKDIQELFLEIKVVGKTLSKGIEYNSQSFKKQADRILSIGERLSALIFSNLLKKSNSQFNYLDSRKIIKTDSQFQNAKPNYEETKFEIEKELLLLIENHQKFVCEGFIGSTHNGFTTTLGRGGSDFSAAIIGAFIHAHEIQIWTDVAGIFSADPRIVKETRLIPEISFDEASEICQFGAKVLHPATIYPALNENIPVKILSTFEPEKTGTVVKKESKIKNNYTALTIRKKQTLLSLSKTSKGLNTHFLQDFFKLLAEYKIDCDLISSNNSNILITLDESMADIELNINLIEELKKIGSFSLHKNYTLVGLVGCGLDLSEIFSLTKELKIKNVNWGASKQGLYILFEDENSAIKFVQLAHSELILKGNPHV